MGLSALDFARRLHLHEVGAYIRQQFRMDMELRELFIAIGWYGVAHNAHGCLLRVLSDRLHWATCIVALFCGAVVDMITCSACSRAQKSTSRTTSTSCCASSTFSQCERTISRLP